MVVVVVVVLISPNNRL